MVRLAQGKRDRFRFAEQELGRGAAFLFQADDADRTALFQFLKRSARRGEQVISVFIKERLL